MDAKELGFRIRVSKYCECGHPWTDHKVIDENKLICLSCPMTRYGHHVTCEVLYTSVMRRKRHKLGKPLR